MERLWANFGRRGSNKQPFWGQHAPNKVRLHLPTIPPSGTLLMWYDVNRRGWMPILLNLVWERINHQRPRNIGMPIGEFLTLLINMYPSICPTLTTNLTRTRSLNILQVFPEIIRWTLDFWHLQIYLYMLLFNFCYAQVYYLLRCQIFIHRLIHFSFWIKIS